MGSVLMRCLSLRPLVLAFTAFTLLGCQSRLDVAGQDHALVVKKWQELANYRDRTTKNSPFTVVAKLAVNKLSGKPEYILSDIHITQEETKFELNLIRPTFEDKYICEPVCSKLNEYFRDSQTNSTMLNQYFERHEFELFKFYGDMVLLDDSISELLTFSPNATTQYFSWLMKKEQKFQNLASITSFLKLALTKDSLIAFLNTPDDFYMELLSRSQSVITDLNLWNLGDNNPETANWTTTPTGDEVLLSMDKTIKNATLSNWRMQNSKPITIGDQVCSYELNEFGIVNEIIGSKVQVKLVGKLIKILDGRQVPTQPGDIYNNQLEQIFVPITKQAVYQSNLIGHCDISLNQKKVTA